MRDKILRSAMEQISKFGLRRFTVDDIAADLGISKKTFYKYFASKKELISAVVEYHHRLEIERTLQALETRGCWQDKLEAVICCQSPSSNVPLWLLEELQRYFPEEWAKTEGINRFKWEKVKELVNQGIQRGEVRPDVNLAVLELALNKTVMALFDYSFLKEKELTVNLAMEDFKKIVLHGIMKKKQNTEDVGECSA